MVLSNYNVLKLNDHRSIEVTAINLNSRTQFVEFRGCQANAINKRKQILQPILKSYEFVPNDAQVSKVNALNFVLQLVVENTTGLKIKIIEVIDDQEPLFKHMIEILKDQPLVQTEMKLLANKQVATDGANCTKIQTLIGETDCQLIYVPKLSKKEIVSIFLFWALHQLINSKCFSC